METVQLVILFLEVSPAPSRHPVVSTRCFTGRVRVGTIIPQDGNRANRYKHVAVVHGHVWRTLCSVCATGARVAHPVPCNFYRPDYNLAKKNII